MGAHAGTRTGRTTRSSAAELAAAEIMLQLRVARRAHFCLCIGALATSATTCAVKTARRKKAADQQQPTMEWLCGGADSSMGCKEVPRRVVPRRRPAE